MRSVNDYKDRRIEWLDYRAKVLKRRNFKCERCGATQNLHVHHPEYGNGRKPWEYHVDFCELLCRGCHAKEHGKVPPDSNWILLFSDLEFNCPSDPIPCSACQRDITWHFTIFHPDWGEWVVGSGCAERLSLSAEAQYLQGYQRRMDTFLHSPRWNDEGGAMTIKQDGQLCRIEVTQDKIRVQIGDKNGQENYADVNAAKQRIFLVLEHRRVMGIG